MDLVNHCVRILEEFHQLTLPTLGKFELIFKSVQFNPETKKNSPPYYKINFSQQHNLNDYSIANEISKYENKEEKEIKNEIINTIVEWKKILKEEGILELDKFGTFSSEKEKLFFQTSENCMINHKNYGLPII